jgi:adenylylsulfate kinase
LGKLLEQALKNRGEKVIRLDSDTLPRSIIKPMSESWELKQQLKLENLYFLAKSFYACDAFVIIAAVGRFREWRDRLRLKVPDYVEIYLKCPLDIRLGRDSDQKYARSKEYYHFYEEPLAPELLIETNKIHPQTALRKVIGLMEERGYLKTYSF